MNVKTYCTCKKDYSCKYLRSIAGTLVIRCDEIISVMGIISTKMTNTIATNVAKNCCNQKIRHKFDYCLLQTVLLVIILLLIITIIWNYYPKIKSIDARTT